jgi:dynein heavy chain 1
LVSFKVEEVLNVEAQITLDIKSLETCPYSAKTFSDILAKIQKAIDDLSLKQYSNLTRWVQHIDTEVEKRLALRLEAGIGAWTAKLEGQAENEDNDTDTEAKIVHKLGGEPEVSQM